MQKIYNLPTENYTIIPNSLLRDTRLSEQAKMLAFYLMSLPKDWEINWNAIAKDLNKSTRTLQRYKQELIDLGYLTIKTLKKSLKNVLIFNTFEASDNLSEAEILAKCDKNDTTNLSHIQINNITNNKYKESLSETEAEVVLKKPLFHTLLDSYKKIKKGIASLESLKLDDKTLKIAKEWIKMRKENFNISELASIRRIELAKNRGEDIAYNLQYCLDRDYRGYFNIKKAQNTPKRRNSSDNFAKEGREAGEILNYLMQNYPKWQWGDDLSGVLVNGRKVGLNSKRNLCYI